jgi:hypothetical protein
MKNIIKIMAWAVIVLFTACTEEALDDLTGKYPPPTDYTLTKIVAQQTQKMTGMRIFTLKMATDGVSATFNEQTLSYTFTGTGNYISIDFVGRNYSLEAGAYTIAPNETAKAGNYIAGYDADSDNGMVFSNWGTCFFDVNNGAETGSKITNGMLSVAKTGDNYQISGVLALDNGQFIRVDYNGTIVFPEDPPVITYTNEVQAPYMWTMDGMTFNPVIGSQLNKITIKSDGAPVAYFEIVTIENPASFSGIYPVSGMITDANGAVVQGVYMDLSEFVPGLIIESGSYLLDGDVKQYLNSGNLTINDNGGVLTFTSSDLDVAVMGVPVSGVKSANYPGATLEGGGTGGGNTHTNLFSAQALDLSAFGLSGFTVTLKVATPGLIVNVESGLSGESHTYAGNGQYISFDFSRDAGDLPPGVYNVKDNTTAQVGDCLAGYPSFFGAGFMGTFVGNVVDGVATEEIVTGGTVTVTDDGFSFTLITASGEITGRYTGEITF